MYVFYVIVDSSFVPFCLFGVSTVPQGRGPPTEEDFGWIWELWGDPLDPPGAPKVEPLGAFLPAFSRKAGKVKSELPCRRELNFGSWRESLESPGASAVHVFGDLVALLVFVTVLCVNLEKVSKTPGVSSVEVLKPTRYLNFQSGNAINTW